MAEAAQEVHGEVVKSYRLHSAPRALWVYRTLMVPRKMERSRFPESGV